MSSTPLYWTGPAFWAAVPTRIPCPSLGEAPPHNPEAGGPLDCPGQGESSPRYLRPGTQLPSLTSTSCSNSSRSPSAKT
jgi:hypothetical protein